MANIFVDQTIHGETMRTLIGTIALTLFAFGCGSDKETAGEPTDGTDVWWKSEVEERSGGDDKGGDDTDDAALAEAIACYEACIKEGGAEDECKDACPLREGGGDTGGCDKGGDDKGGDDKGMDFDDCPEGFDPEPPCEGEWMSTICVHEGLLWWCEDGAWMNENEKKD
jgi:hypothetical protein